MNDDDLMGEDPMAELTDDAELTDEAVLTDAERREAEALARALDRGSADDPPDDALSAAALLRYSQDGGDLAQERREAIFADVLATARPKRPSLDVKRGWLAWLFPAGGLAMTAAAVALFVSLQTSTPPVALQLPAPDPGLLTAQVAAAADTSEQTHEALASQMQAYRGDVLTALEERYAQ